MHSYKYSVQARARLPLRKSLRCAELIHPLNAHPANKWRPATSFETQTWRAFRPVPEIFSPNLALSWAMHQRSQTTFRPNRARGKLADIPASQKIVRRFLEVPRCPRTI